MKKTIKFASIYIVNLLILKECPWKLFFKDVKEYSFYWNSNYYHNYIENLKYIQCDGLHYISFDPDETVDTISESDNDFIYCSEIVLEK